MRPLRLLAASAGLVLAALPFRLSAQDALDHIVKIDLLPITEKDTTKYGIYATLGGSTTPALYEFDTGGSGFYTAYGTGATSWGTNFTPTGTNTSNLYESGDLYQGSSATTSFALYSAHSDGTAYSIPALQTATNIVVVQATSITNIYSKGVTQWPMGPDQTAPVEKDFWGDFGLNLTSGTNGVLNPLLQIPVTNGIRSGFILRLTGTDRSLQVGIKDDDLSKFPIQIQMAGQNTNVLFPHTGDPTYASQIINGILNLSDSASGPSSTNMPVTLDSGAHPTMRIATNGFVAPLTNYITSDGTNLVFDDNVDIVVSATQIDGSNVTLYQLLTDTNTDTTLPIETNSPMQINYLNLGSAVYEQYDVMYDAQDGILGLRAVPEASQAALMAGGVLSLIAFAGGRSLLRKRRIKFRRN